MMTRLFLALALLAAPSASYAQPKTVVLKQRLFVCKRMGDAEQYARLVAHGDVEAFTAFTAAKEFEQIPGTGSACHFEDKGERLTVSDSAQGSVAPLECFRPSGYVACYWGFAMPSE